MSSDPRQSRSEMSAFAIAWQSGDEQVVNAHLRARCHRRGSTADVPQVQLTAPSVWKVRPRPRAMTGRRTSRRDG